MNELKPKAFIRSDDRQRMSINENGTYSWDYQKERPEHLIFEYPYDKMIYFVEDGSFELEF